MMTGGTLGNLQLQLSTMIKPSPVPSIRTLAARKPSTPWNDVLRLWICPKLGCSTPQKEIENIYFITITSKILLFCIFFFGHLYIYIFPKKSTLPPYVRLKKSSPQMVACPDSPTYPSVLFGNLVTRFFTYGRR